MSLRDRQKAYYYNKLDAIFPGVREKYEKRFGCKYSCYVNNYKKLADILHEACDKYGMSLKMPSYEHKLSSVQLTLFDKL